MRTAQQERGCQKECIKYNPLTLVSPKKSLYSFNNLWFLNKSVKVALVTADETQHFKFHLIHFSIAYKVISV